ncbi:hypothetical protein A6U92_11545 [Agrobacterium rubi]|nr:hypothetical protein A6U92_11545 [Agrobacterium rubi]
MICKLFFMQKDEREGAFTCRKWQRLRHECTTFVSRYRRDKTVRGRKTGIASPWLKSLICGA